MEIFLSLAEAVMEFSQPQRIVLSLEYCGKNCGWLKYVESRRRALKYSLNIVKIQNV